MLISSSVDKRVSTREGSSRRGLFANCFGVLILVLITGCVAYIKPSAYTVALQEKAKTKVSSGCPLIQSEWKAEDNAAGIRREEPHSGIDIHGPRGTPILASAPGKVLLVDRISHDGGLFVAIHHGADESGNHVYTTYWHLDTTKVKPGEEVKRGQQIATMGASGGRSGGIDNYHLHMTPLVDPTGPPEFKGGKITLLQFESYRNLGVNPRFLWYPYSSNGSPTSAGVAQRYVPSTTYEDKPGRFTGLTYPIPCQ